MTVVCVDSPILIYALSRRNSSIDERLVRDAADFLAWLDSQGAEVLVPSIVIGEVLCGVTRDDEREEFHSLTNEFMTAPYDVPAALKFSRLFGRGASSKQAEVKAIRDSGVAATSRDGLKADLMIIATALAHNASILYTHDEEMIRLANGLIDARDFVKEDFPRRLPFPHDE